MLKNNKLFKRHEGTSLYSTNKSETIVGIDLGTTNSVVAIYDAGAARVIQNKNGAYITPSVVAYADIPGRGLNCIVGQMAKRQSVVNPENTFYSVKRLIGSKFEEIKDEAKRLSYHIKKDDNGKIRIDCPILNKDFSPEEISAIVLKTLVEDAQNALRQDIKQAVITVPAYFNDSQRLATKDAGLIAGLDVLRILNEPTAAALAYGLDKKKNEVVLIFDLGGGTFDVSILEVGNEVFEVLATSGDTHLGGDDFDHVILDYILNDVKKEHGISLEDNKQALQRILEASEAAKIALSSLDSTQISLPFIAFKNGVGISIDLTLDRSKFEELSKDLLEKCKGPVLQALKDAKVSKLDIHEAVLVGGSTRIPAVKKLLRDLLGKELNESVNPDEVVALGAAIQGGIISGQITDLILLDVTPLTLGLETMGGLMTPILGKNTSIPAKQTEIFSTATDNQPTVDIHVLQGERSLAIDNKSLGLFKLTGIPPAPRGVPQISVTFQLDADGLLSVSARDQQSGREQSIKIEGASNLDRSEVDRMIKDAESNIIGDKALRAYSLSLNDTDAFFEEIDLFNQEYAWQANQLPSYKYFDALIKILEDSYIDQDFSSIDESFFEELQFTYEILVQELISDLENKFIYNL